MTRRRTSLRTRLVASIVLVALAVLALSYGATFALVRRSLQQNALSSLRKRSSELADIAQDTSLAARPRARLQLALRLTDIRVVAIRPNGNVVASAADTSGLPAPVTAGDILPSELLAGREVSGRIGSTVYLAIPSDRYIGRARIVVVATDAVDTSVLSRAIPLMMLAGIVVLCAAAGVAVWLARRLTRPLHAVEQTATRIAGGDLSAHTDLPSSADAELVTLAATLDAMAAQLAQTRGSERAFLLSISHDLRTPLTSIRGYADALADGTLDDADPQARARAAAVIGAEARRLERLVRDLLDLSRLESRQFSLQPRPCDATTLVRDATDAFVPQAHDLGIELLVHNGPPLAVDVDPERVGQIVANLVENALKYANTRVEVYAAADGPDRVALVVTDDGPGIPADQLGLVFERLYTGRSVPGRSVGTGLGLAIVRELAGAMGGHAYADTPANGGSRFVVSLPSNT